MRPYLHQRFFAIVCTVLCMMLVAACGNAPPADTRPGAQQTVPVRLIAFNDFHGHLEPPRMAIAAPNPDGGSLSVPAGGAAYLAGAIAQLKVGHPNHAVVSAGDMIGASPLISALFLDEPTIEAFNRMGIDFNAVGNHEFDKGAAELLRMKNGGCAKHTALEPCRLDKAFPGANFSFLAANTVKPDGATLFPATAIKTFVHNGVSVKVGFIGMTLKGTPAIVTPSGVAGLTFRDEAETANALIPGLKAQGVNAIVVVVHEGGQSSGGYKSCDGLSGDILPIIDRLDAAVDVVISGHTHRAYICEIARQGRPLLLTSAGQYGTLLTVIDLSIDGASGRIVRKTADNIIVQGEPLAAADGRGGVGLTDRYPAFAPSLPVAQLVAKYAEAVRPLERRAVGRISAAITRKPAPSREHALGNLIADAQLAATRSPAVGGAEVAFMNPGGVRTDMNYSANDAATAGVVTYGQLFSIQPFGNSLVVKTFTGAQIQALLEQQFASGSNTVATPRVLMPSQGFSYTYDLARPAGGRISAMMLNGRPVLPAQRYRVAMNSFLAEGGDNFTVFRQGTDALGGAQDIDALEAYLSANSPVPPPAVDRIRRDGP